MIKSIPTLPGSLGPECCDYILIYGLMKPGGIQTLILRYVDFLLENKIKVHLVCKGGPLLSSLNPIVSLYVYRNTIDLIRVSSLINCISVNFASAYRLLSFDGPSLIDGFCLEALIPSIKSHISGVFHPRAYFMDDDHPLRHKAYYYALKGRFNCKIFFMNSECLFSCSRKFPELFRESVIIPLPIRSHPYRYVPSKSNNHINIVSVGRYTSFKAYNLSASQIIDECQLQGISVTWTFFGYGPLKEEMIRLAFSTGKCNQIRILDTLDYTDFADVVNSFDLFVGMGTAALEASCLGVPAIFAIDGNKYYTHGFTFDLPFGNVGEELPNRGIHRISKLISYFANLSFQQKLSISQSCRSATKDYSLDNFHALISNLFDSIDHANKFMQRSLFIVVTSVLLMETAAMLIRFRLILHRSCLVLSKISLSNSVW